MSAFNLGRVDDKASKRRRMASTPEVERSIGMSDSPSFSSVNEFPLSGECVDRTIEIGSDGDECSAESEPMIFPSKNELSMSDRESEYSSEANDSASDGFIYPSDQEVHRDGSDSNDVDITTGPGTPQCAFAESRSTQDIQSELVDVGATLVSGCCQQQCLLSLTPKAVLSVRKLNSMTSNAQRQWVADKVFEGHRIQGGKAEVQFNVSGVNVCHTAWCKLHQISRKKLTRVTRDVARGLVIVQHGNKGTKRNSVKIDTAKTWMERYFHLVGDKMPHNGQIHLPSWESRKDVYVRYCSDMSQQQLTSQDTVQLSTFYKIWSDHFPTVVIPEVRLILVSHHSC